MKLVLLALGLFVSVATSSTKFNGFIVDGEDTSIEEYPYMAGIMNLGISSCGGSIINSRSVLTAAHCILIRSAPMISVFVGSSRRRGQDGTTYRALRVALHPDYIFVADPFQLQADIAVIRTISQIRFGALVNPIGLGTEFVNSGAQVVLTGWGLMGNSTVRDRADQLQKLKMTTIPNILCSLLHVGTEAEGVVSAEKLCAVGAEDSGACGGDSGGPITHQGTVVGVVSWGLRPCGQSPTVFIRVAHHLQWIRQQL